MLSARLLKVTSHTLTNHHRFDDKMDVLAAVNVIETIFGTAPPHSRSLGRRYSL